MAFLAELIRRNVFRIAGLYLAGAWLIVQVASTVLPAFGGPGWALRAIITVLAIGVVPALVFAWVFELTPEGLKLEKNVARGSSVLPQTGRKLDRLIMAVLALALGYFAFDKFVLAPRRAAEQASAARAEGRSQALVESYGDKSIAVLPFADMSPDGDQEYFSDGISEELLNLLAQLPQLRVISRSSAFSFKGKDVAVPEIARRLNVVHVLEGSVRKSGSRVRITAQLIDARSDTHLWSETYDRPLDDIFAVQDEIAAAVVAQLKLKLLGAAPKTRVVDPAAYALYLQGRQLWQQRTPDGLARSIELYEQALAIDPRDAPAWCGLAASYISQAGDGLRSIDEGYRLAREAVHQALAIDPEYALAHGIRGRIALEYDGDLAAAARHLEHAQALEPANTEIIRFAAYLARSLGRIDQSISLGEFVTARDPVNPVGYINVGYQYLYAGRMDDAIASRRTALSLSPGYRGAHYLTGVGLLLKGESDEALAAMQKESLEPVRLAGLAMALHAVGRQPESDRNLAALIRDHEQSWSYNVANVLAFRGEADRAFEWLDKAIGYHDTGLAEIAVDPLFASLHDDPRWLPLLRRIGKAPEQLAAIEFEVMLPAPPL